MLQKQGFLLLLALALHANQSHAQADGAGSTVPDTGKAGSPAPELILPIFEPLPIKNAAFWEQFTEDSKTRWKPSHATKKGDSDTARYDGEWAIEEVSKLAGVKGDSALVVKSEARHHAISARLEKPFDPAKEGMVLQYEVKLQEDLGCGGAYIKLLTAPFKGEFSDATPYTVMFGPDKCGESKVHLIFRHRNPISGDYTEHHLKHRLNPPTDNLSHLYSLAIQTNNTFTVAIDGSTQHTGSLLEDFAPPVNPPKEIDDPNDKKPADWEDDAEIPDPDAKKPEDWDEDAPRMIPDEDAVMPKDWLADEPLMVPDPSVEKPSDWDDDEDGEWSAPVIPNPRCVGVAGCGPWERPVVRNPKYKGEWFAPLIDNPRYKGEWAPRRISNPDYFEDLDLYKLTKIDAVGFELWTMQAGISFDNIYLGGSENIAAQLAEDVWKTKHDSELAVSEALHPKPPPPAKPAFYDMMRLFKTRFEEIGASIFSFYHATKNIGIISALRQEKSGAFAVAMAISGLSWLLWNLAVIVRFIFSLILSSSPAPTPGSTETVPAGNSASTGVKAGSSRSAATKRNAAKSG